MFESLDESSPERMPAPPKNPVRQRVEDALTAILVLLFAYLLFDVLPRYVASPLLQELMPIVVMLAFPAFSIAFFVRRLRAKAPQND